MGKTLFKNNNDGRKQTQLKEFGRLLEVNSLIDPKIILIFDNVSFLRIKGHDEK